MFEVSWNVIIFNPTIFSDLNEFDATTLRTLNDPKYLEHDSFALFQQLIMLLEGWFITDSEFESSSPTNEEAALFAR
jgi:hypothetical protein